MSGCEAKVPALRFKVTPAENAEGGLLSSNAGGTARTPAALWKRNRFGEIATRKSTMGNAVALPRVEYEDVIPFSGFFNNDIFAKPSDKIGVQFSEGDVLFGKLRPYLGNWILAEFKGLAVGDWWVLRPKGIDSEFLYTLIQSPSFQDVANQSSGSKMPRADWSLVSETFFSCPNDPVEQRRIGSLFRSLDALIAGREKALEKLEALKKSMLLKMFPQGDATVPEVRFKGFTGEWEKSSFDKMFIHIPSKAYQIQSTNYRESGQFPVVDQGKVRIVGYTDSAGKVFKAKDNPVIVFGDHTREVKFVDFDFVVGADGTQLLRTPENDIQFMSYVVQSTPLPNMGYSRHFKFLQEATFLAPTLPEQQKIGAYFRSLDALLAARRDEIAKLKNLKKALLDRMFV
ncbi:MAG: hypothetical protein MSB12_04960 [Lentisphaeraceae bacterium]|nr:hypothetical protein [Lentisphaeraceae bacterium]